jgi:imidazole glycerol-phosphate synthase subunit HisH
VIAAPKALLVDAGTGNLGSVYHALVRLGYAITLTQDPASLPGAERVILPGVGAFRSFMDGLHQRGLEPALRDAVARGVPLLGICVGMQALFEASSEMGAWPGLGFLPGQVVRFEEKAGYKIPHTGWNQLWPRRESPLLDNLEPGAYAYFNHSFYCAPGEGEDTLGQTDYCLDFASIVQHGRIYGVQFHPEKSQAVGERILRNFMEVC